MQPPCVDFYFTSWIYVSTLFLLLFKELKATSYLAVLMSQYLEYLFEEKPNKLLNLEHADGLEESSPLVLSSSSSLRELEQLGSSMDSLLLLKECS